MNHYERLEIDRNATDFEIRKAYRKAALRAHPDKNPNSREEAEEEFKKIGTAYEVLNDPKKRGEYNQYLDSLNRDEKEQGENAQQQWTDPNVDMQQAEQILIMVNALLKQHREEKKRRKELGEQLANKVKEKKWNDVADLIEQNASLHELSDEGFGLLHYAVLSEDYKLVNTFLSLGANINLIDSDGKTPLHHAVAMNNYEMCKLLIEKNAKSHYQDYANKETPLHCAIENKKDQRIQLLLVQKAHDYGTFWTDKSYNIKDLLGDTPLHLSIKKKQFKTTNLLIAYEAKTTIKNNSYKTPVDLVAEDMEVPLQTRNELKKLNKSELENQSSCAAM